MYFERKKPKKLHKYARTLVMGLLVFSLISMFTVRVAVLQIVNHSEYRAEADYSSAISVKVKAARGEILDRYGRPIAVNRDGYNIVFNAAYFSKMKRNSIISDLVKLLRDNKQEWTDILPMKKKAPYSFTKKSEKAVADLKKDLGLNTYATAQNCFDAMVEKYKLEAYSAEHQREIMGVRYSMEAADFSVALPFTFAEDVSETVRSRILEDSMELRGVEIQVVPVREYTDPALAAQIIGAVGPIYAEDWEELKEKGYSYDDTIGKSGVEAAFEEYLRGTDGTNLILTDSQGNTTTVVDKPAVAGNTVMLTIDAKLQKVAQESLRKTIYKIQASGARQAAAGSVVVINVKTGEVLASANYPSYDLETYQKDYNSLLKDPAKPLFDRAFTGLYQPGSTFKPAVAAAGLTTGRLTSSHSVYCRQFIDVSDMTFKCEGYHGSMNVTQALSRSCNIFFYDLAQNVGIGTMNKYCRLFGLGVKSGVEITESAGILAGPEYRKEQNGYWYLGDTVQAAIGQSDNLFTPLQLATYCATIANGGTRYQSHLLHAVRSYNLSSSIVEPTATVVAETGISESAVATVKRGMLSAAFEGTASSVFGKYPIQVGGKTGTAQTIGPDNGVFISFAPYENSEIAVAIVVEHALHGYVCAPVVKDIYNAYFFGENLKDETDKINTLLD